MRAWLFILIVLATFKPIVQVASTEENISKSLESTLSNRNTEEEENNSDKTKEYSMNDKSRRTHSKKSNRNSIKNSYTDESSSVSDDTEYSDKSTSKPDPESLVQIEKSLLTLFGMSKRPKIDRSKIVIPDAMKQLYAQIMGHELDSVNIPKAGLHTKSANTVRSFTHEESRIDKRFLHHHKFRLFFNITSIPPDEKLKAAELTLSRDAVNDGIANRTRHQVLVYDIIRPGIKGKRDPIFLLIDTKSVRINSSDSISLDVQPAVDRWLSEPKRNFGLLVQIVSGRDNSQPPEHKHVRLRRSLDEPNDHWSHKQPLLLTYTDDGRHKPRSIRDANRSKRAHHKRSNKRKNGRGICSRRPLYVDFSDVGWSDWIVAPQGYDAYYCQGDCPFPLSDHLNSTNHAAIQTLVNSISPSRVPKACCVPTQLAAISMLYLNEQNSVVLKNYQDMSVIGCGCR